MFFVFVTSLTRLQILQRRDSGASQMTYSWLNQYLLYNLIKIILMISETKVGHKADLGHSVTIHFCIFFSTLKNCRIGLIGIFDDARLRIGVLMKLSTGMLTAFSEKMITYSEPIKTHKHSMAKGLPFAFSDAPFHHGSLNFVNSFYFSGLP